MNATISPRNSTEATAAYAASLYDQDYYCSEAIVKTACELTDRSDSDDLVRMATGFGAGIGRTQSTCGALAGAIMAVGLLSGRSEPDGPYRPSTDAARELLAKFEDEFGSSHCREIIAPFGTMRGEGRHKHCRAVVGTCAAWVREIAEREGRLARADSRVAADSGAAA